MGFAEIWGLDYQQTVMSFSESSTLGERNFVRWIAVLSQVFTFLVPGLALAFIFFRTDWLSFLGLKKGVAIPWLLAGMLLMLISMPFVEFLYEINRQIPLPDWVLGMESNTENLIRNLLVTDHFYELIFNLVLIAILPAIGEEIFFRGIVQKQLSTFFANPILGIWVAAFLFSAIHFQFQGFLPRLWLGAILGYLFYWTGSLWAPIAAHFANNASQVLLIYLYNQHVTELNIQEENPYPLDLTFISLGLTIGIGYFIWKAHRSDNPVHRLSESAGAGVENDGFKE